MGKENKMNLCRAQKLVNAPAITALESLVNSCSLAQSTTESCSVLVLKFIENTEMQIYQHSECLIWHLERSRS